MYEAEIGKLEKLTERVKSGKDISYEEADWISQWIIPDSTAYRIFKNDLRKKIETCEMQEPLKRWFEAVYEAMCAGRTGAFKNTIPLYFSSLDINDVLKKCLSKLSPIEKASSIEVNRVFYESLPSEIQSFFVDKNEFYKGFYKGIETTRACTADRVGFDSNKYSLIMCDIAAAGCECVYCSIEDNEKDSKSFLTQCLRYGGSDEIKSYVIGVIMHQMKINYIYVNSFYPEYYYNEVKQNRSWDYCCLYISKEDRTKLKPYLKFSKHDLINLILSSDRIPQSEKDRLDIDKTQSYLYPTLGLIKTAAEILKERVAMIELEEKIQQEKKEILDSDDWTDIIR